jgi:tetratricopeptide (TPR) repeat protein
LLVPLVLLAGVELALRLWGYGYTPRFFLRSQAQGKEVWIENQAFGRRFFGAAAARTPRPITLPIAKPADTYRIFVFGESAALGDPEPAFGFSRILALLLRGRYPDTKFEVANVAITAINSHVVLPIARDCAPRGGDLWIIYMGHNEVVGPFGAGTVFGPQTPSLAFIRVSIALKATRTGQLLDTMMRRLAGPKAERRAWGGMEMFLEQQLRQEDRRMGMVYAHFQRNLADLLGLGSKAAVKVIATTVPSNLKDCAPFASLHRPDLTQAQQANWDKLYQVGMTAEAAGKLSEAETSYRQAAQIDDRFAELQFRWGRCCWELGQFEAARQHFILARDYDTLRFRADTRLNGIIRQTAQDYGRDDVVFVDVNSVFEQQSPHAILDRELFFEHVHLNFNGNYLLARTLAEQIAQLLPPGLSSQPAPQSRWMSAEECAHGLALTDWNRYETAELLRQRMSQPPFTHQLDHAGQYKRQEIEVKRLRDSLTPAKLQEAVASYRNALANTPGDWVLHEKLARLLNKSGDRAGAVAQWQRVIELAPHYHEAYCQLGLALEQQGKSAEATTHFLKALQLNPSFPEALHGLGLALASQGRFTEAISHYESALRLKPDFAEAHANLGLAHSQLGDLARAQHHYTAALRLKPDYVIASINLGKLLDSAGALSQLISNYTEAARLEPTNAMAHFNLGNALVKSGRLDEGWRHYAEAVRLQPDFAEARCKLGFELGRRGNDAEAMREFAEAVRLKPDYGEAHFNLGVALAKQRRFDEAMTHFRNALRLDPKDESARKYLLEAERMSRKGP